MCNNFMEYFWDMMKKFFSKKIFLFCFFIFIFSSSSFAFKIVGDMGYKSIAPENTYAAAQACIDIGCDVIKVDIRTSKDGVPYLLSDTKVDRTTDGHGRISFLQSDYLDTLDAGSWFDKRFKGEKIPKLKEFLKWLKGRLNIFLDVKDANIRYLISLVEDLGYEDKCFFGFMHRNQMLEFKSYTIHHKLSVKALNSESVEAVVEDLSPQIIKVDYNNLSDKLIGNIKKFGLKFLINVEEDFEENFKKAIYLNPQYIQTKHLKTLKRVKKKLFN